MNPGCSVSYDFYANEFLGNAISQEDFPALAARGCAYIRAATRGLCRNVRETDMLKRAVCAAAEVFQDEYRLSGRTFTREKRVAKETVGNYSVSYDTGGLSDRELAFLEKRKRDAVLVYLSGIPALASLFQVRSFPCTHRIR